MPIIWWKFKSLKNEPYKKISFSGIDISVSDLCDLIMKDTGIMVPAKLKLLIFDASSGEEYQDHTDMIPRNKSVYVVKVPITAEPEPLKGKSLDDLLKEEEEKSKILDLLEEVSCAYVTPSTTEKAKSMTKPSGTYNEQFSARPPPGYVCHTCGGKDHFRQKCPMGKVHRPLGIPSSHLQRLPSGVDVEGSMLGYDGSRVMLKTDVKAMVSHPKKFPKNEVKEVEIPEVFLCTLCKGLLNDAVIITCCLLFFCNDCICSHLLDCDFMCPKCSKSVSHDDLTSVPELQSQVLKFRCNLSAAAKLVAPKVTTTAQPQLNVGVMETPKAVPQLTTTTPPPPAAEMMTLPAPVDAEAVGETESGQSTPSSSLAVLPEVTMPEESSDLVSLHPEEDIDSKPKSPDPVSCGGFDTSTAQSRGSSLPQETLAGVVASSAAQTAPSAAPTRLLLEQTAPVGQPQFTSAHKPFRPSSFGGSLKLLPQAPGFHHPPITRRMLSSNVPVIQFTNRLPPCAQLITQSSTPPSTPPFIAPLLPPPLSYPPWMIPLINMPFVTQSMALSSSKPIPTQSALAAPLSEEEFFQLQKSLKAEHHKGKTVSSTSTSAWRQARSNSVSSSDSVSPCCSRSRGAHSSVDEHSSSKRRKHEHTKSRGSRTSSRFSSSKHKKSRAERQRNSSFKALQKRLGRRVV